MLAVVAAVCTVGQSAGATSVQTLSQRIEIAAGPGTQLLEFDRFDPALGTLVQVIASVRGAVAYPGARINSPAQEFRAPDFTVRAAFDLTVDFTGPDITLHDVSHVAARCDKFELAGSGAYLPCIAELPRWTDSAFDLRTIDPTAVSGFVGAAPARPLFAVVTFETRYIDAETGVEIARPGGPFGRVSGVVDLDYLFLPPLVPDPPPAPLPAVPLPATAPLMALSAAALWRLARRRGH